MCCSHVYTSGMEYVVKNAPPSALSLPGNPYTSTSRGELAALFHAIKWSRPSRTTTIFSTTSTMALNPIVGCPVSGTPLPHEPCKSYPRLRGYLGTSAALTLALPPKGVIDALPDLLRQYDHFQRPMAGIRYPALEWSLRESDDIPSRRF